MFYYNIKISHRWPNNLIYDTYNLYNKRFNKYIFMDMCEPVLGESDKILDEETDYSVGPDYVDIAFHNKRTGSDIALLHFTPEYVYYDKFIRII